MRTNARTTVLAAALALGAAFAPAKGPARTEKAMSPALKARVRQFAPVSVGVDAAQIPAKHRKALKHIIRAAELIDQLYLRQVASENPTWRKQIAKDPSGGDALAYFDIMYGPWDRLEAHKPFWGAKARPKGATFYPEDLSAQELEAYMAKHPEQKEALGSYFTVVRRDGDKLKAIPYSEAYREFLEPAAKHLEAAAQATPDARLAAFLRARAQAFRSNDYRESDMAWMDLGDGDLEVAIGPYEVYNDELMGLKAAFEAFVTLRDHEASQELAKITAFIPDMQKGLPVPDEFKGATRGMESPISVVNVLYNGGDNRPGVQTLAFNLPNDEVVREKKGSKKVMLKNISEAKFQKILLPIVKAMLRADQAAKVTHKAFFNHTLVHEVGHGIGPGTITVVKDGRPVQSTVNQELKNLYSTIEEAKADTLGLYDSLFLIDKGLHPESFREEVYATFLGGFFRSVRFGVHEAHGQANAIQFNYLFEKGAILKDADGKYAYDAARMPGAIRDLAHDIIMIEAKGDFEGAKAFIAKYGQLPQDLLDRLASLNRVPTDIRLSFPLEKTVGAW